MPVCVAGMHRSGTSMVTNFLQACGLYLGPFDDIMPAAPENPEGFWENFKFVEINEEILNQLGGGWDCPPPEPDDWTAGRLAPVALHAETIIEHFTGREPWGWKDPRNSLTVPFWQTFFPEMRVVVVVRNPLEVALSLRKRNGFSFALGLSLWYIAYRRVLDATTDENRIVTHYDAYFGDSGPEILRLTDFLKLPASDATIESLTSASALRHHRLTTEDLLAADVSPDVLALYRD
ncbi:MAG: sulfotransferase, partial [Chloroflexota bacterium]|nr:sulfotransferase [Chloroflexota bacterium]